MPRKITEKLTKILCGELDNITELVAKKENSFHGF
jgi:hypothetical protein